MFCRHCGTQVDHNNRFCPHCGHELLASPQASPPYRDNRKRKTPTWLKLLLSLALIGLLFLASLFFLREDLHLVIEEQLAALKSNKITEAYYDFTSRDFQNSTSLDVFREFVKAYPTFSTYQSFTVDNQSLENGIGTLNGTLKSKEGQKTEVQYKLVKEGEKWKILSIRLLENTPEGNSTAPVSAIGQAMIYPVQEHLQAIHNRDFAKAYEHVSKDFAAENPVEKYEAFVQDYPLLLNSSKAEYEVSSTDDDHGDVTVILESPEGPLPVEYKLVKENDQWKIWGLKLFLPTNQSSVEQPTDITPLLQMIRDQLKSLSLGDIKMAYDHFTSKEFKEATTLEAFKEFVQRYPILTNFKSIDFKNPVVGHERGRIKVDLHEEGKITAFEYSIGKENGQWKVWGIYVSKNLESPSLKEPILKDSEQLPISQTLSKTILEQLKEIRKGDLSKAYHEYNSEDFKKATSLEEFVTFIKSQPGLYENDAFNLNNLTFNNNVGTFTGTLTAKNAKTYSVEYELIKENNRWKILHILIPSQSQANASETTKETKTQPNSHSYIPRLSSQMLLSHNDLVSITL